MTIKKALTLVLDMAEQNAISLEETDRDAALYANMEMQQEALQKIQKLIEAL